MENQIRIKLTDNAHIEGYNGAFYRFTTEEGKPSACGIWDNWYEATAVDDNGNQYRVVWNIKPDFDINSNADESDACDWDNPAEIINIDNDMPVNATIEW